MLELSKNKSVHSCVRAVLPFAFCLTFSTIRAVAQVENRAAKNVIAAAKLTPVILIHGIGGSDWRRAVQKGERVSARDLLHDGFPNDFLTGFWANRRICSLMPPVRRAATRFQIRCSRKIFTTCRKAVTLPICRNTGKLKVISKTMKTRRTKTRICSSFITISAFPFRPIRAAFVIFPISRREKLRP